MKLPADEIEEVEVLQRERTYTGKVWAIERDLLVYAGERIVRDFMSHYGAVAILAVSQAGDILVITQYRHPVGMRMVEIPAGLLDVAGEQPLSAAKRELLEETGYTASKWAVLADICTSPGSTSENLRIFLAEGLDFVGRPVPTDAEEKNMELHWVAPAAAVQQVLAGEWQNPTAVVGVLAYTAFLAGAELRAANAAWPIRDWELSSGRIFQA